MDFEKQAREMRTKIEAASRGQSVICDSELPMLVEFARAAYLAGKEDAAKTIERHKTAGDTVTGTTFNRIFEELANEIRDPDPSQVKKEKV